VQEKRENKENGKIRGKAPPISLSFYN